ncbi:hypothetical protein ABFT23_14005 [Nocardioides sp. C4-1]|uniref:hypothetical protein n=1 Tax=Nocardioides sp. C4-1 TaxID=3151851 RepID=UPI003265AAD4
MSTAVVRADPTTLSATRAEAVDGLHRAVGPSSDLAGRLPGGRRRTPALSS